MPYMSVRTPTTSATGWCMLERTRSRLPSDSLLHLEWMLCQEGIDCLGQPTLRQFIDYHAHSFIGFVLFLFIALFLFFFH